MSELIQIATPVLMIMICIGLVSGLLGGMLGIGGGVVIVPCLILLYETTDQHGQTTTVVAVATSLACIVFTSLSAAITQIRAGMVRWDIFRRLLAFFVIGSFTAGALIPYLPSTTLRVIIGLFLLFVGVVMLTNWKPAAHRILPGFLGSSSVGFGGGLIAGTAGIAGGNVIVPTLIYFNVPVHNATATSSAMGVGIAAAGALAYMFAHNPGPSGSQGFVDIYSFVAITLGAIAAAPIGVRLAHKVPAQELKKVFGILLLIVSARMLWTGFTS